LWSLQLLFISIICIWIQLKVCYIFIHMSHQKRLCEEDSFVPTAGQQYAIKSLSLLMSAENHPWWDPVLAAMVAVHWLRMVPWQTPLFLLSAPGIDTGNRYESIWLTNRFGSQKPQHYLLNRHLINLTNSPCCYLESSFAIAGNTSTTHCSYQCINSSYQISISFRVTTSSPNKKMQVSPRIPQNYNWVAV
jgi:hypothetical protein